MLKKVLIALAVLVIVAAIVAFAIGPGYLEKGINRVIEHDAYEISDEARAARRSDGALVFLRTRGL